MRYPQVTQRRGPVSDILRALVSISAVVGACLAPGAGLAYGPQPDPSANANDLGAGAAAPELSPLPADRATELELALFDRVNAGRLRSGLQPVALDVDVLWVARARAVAQVSLPALSHLDADGRVAFADLLAEVPATYRLAGENLARLGAGGDVAGRADEVLMNSPPHRATILEPAFNRLAVGAAFDADGSVVFAEIFRAS